jgi:ribose transport system permease protein
MRENESDNELLTDQKPKIVGVQRAKYFFEAYGTLLGILGICVVFSFLSPQFLKRDNLLAIIAQSSAVGIVSIGLTVVMMTGNLDLSFGSVVGTSGMTAAFLMSNGTNPFIAILAGLSVGVIVGVINGWLVVILGIQALIATIATQAIVFGWAYFYSGGADIYQNITTTFTLIGNGSIAHVPIPAVILLVVLAIAIFVTQFSSLGRYLYAIGGNPIASEFSGIRVSFLKIVTYVIAGFLASIGGIVMLARLQYGAAYTGQGYLLDGFAAVYLGFTILKSGKPNVAGSVIGAAFMMILNNGFQLVNVDFVLQIALKGAILLLIVVTHSRLSMKKE